MDQNNLKRWQHLTKGRGHWGLWLVWAVVIIGLLWWLRAPLTQIGQAIVSFARSEEAIESFVIWLGWFGPPVLILLNALQIVIAPVPAYALFGAAGFLYGPIWGGIYGTLGTLLGASAAMLLTRRFGRPWAARMVGEARLTRWNQMTDRRGWLVWGLLLLAPVGDIPYFLAGLSQVKWLQILVLTIITRVPTIFLVAAAGSGTTSVGWEELAVLLVCLVVIFGILWRYQSVILAWFDERMNPHISRR